MIVFSGSPLDRADAIRSNPAALSALMDGRARLLRMTGLEPVISSDGDLEWGTLAEADPQAELVFLGLMEDGRAAFAAVPEEGSTTHAYPRLWRALAGVDAGQLAIYGGARAVVDWHARHRFCARCGGATVLAKGGWQRNCSACKAEHYPRVDPATIMLVEHDGALLLGRQPRFPKGNYSALAGFVEPGETIEEAVAREVFEEAGLRAHSVTYVMSQPWPFPSSLMIGCHAYAEDRALTIDTTELEDARWFTRDDVADAIAAAECGSEARAFTAPPAFAVAHQLMRWWLNLG